MSSVNPTSTEEYDENMRKLAELRAAGLKEKSPYYGVDWLRELCDKAQRESIVADGRGVWRTIEGLLKAIESEREAREKGSAALRAKDEAMGVLFKRLQAAGVDCSDLIS